MTLLPQTMLRNSTFQCHDTIICVHQKITTTCNWKKPTLSTEKQPSNNSLQFLQISIKVLGQVFSHDHRRLPHCSGLQRTFSSSCTGPSWRRRAGGPGEPPSRGAHTGPGQGETIGVSEEEILLQQFYSTASVTVQFNRLTLTFILPTKTST